MHRQLFPRGAMKPPPGAQINFAHPLAWGHRVSVHFIEGIGLPHLLVTTPVRAAPPAMSFTYPPNQWPVLTANTGVNNFAWVSNALGLAQVCAVTNTTFGLWTIADDTPWLPTTAVTIAVVRRKTDTTLRPTALFGVSPNTVGAPGRLGASVPYSDGTVYWNFGGDAAPNRLTIAGLTFGTGVEKWIFTAGPAGSAIWRNGVKLTSQATAITRTATGTGDPFYLNGGSVSNTDLLEYNSFLMVDRQWSDALCRWWSAEPYDYLYTDPMRRWPVAAFPSEAPTPPPTPGTARATRRMRRWALPNSDRGYQMFLANLELRMPVGIGLTTGQGSDPQVMLRLSRDGGMTWTPEIWTTAGQIGTYLTRVRWPGNLGQYRLGMAEITVTDPVGWAFLDAIGDLTEGTS